MRGGSEAECGGPRTGACAATIVGPGEVGRRLASGLEYAGWCVARATRTNGWHEALQATGTPRILCMREDDLGTAFGRFPPDVRPDLVLVQNGFLEAGLDAAALAPTTRALIWFTSKGDFFLPLRASVLYGPWANQLALAWNSAGIPCEVTADRAVFLREMILKGFWNTVVGLPLAGHGIDLGTYLSQHTDEIAALAAECSAVCAAVFGVFVAPDDSIEMLHGTTRELHWMKASTAKALAWRSGALSRWGRVHDVATPVTDRLLSALGFDSEA